MTRILEGVVKDGTAQSGEVNMPLAGKTGTTSFEGIKGGVRDAWFVGFTPDVVGAVWMGYDRTTKEQYLTGGSEYPVQLFKKVVNKGLSDISKTAFEKPSNVKDLEKPVKLPVVEDLRAEFEFLYGLPAVQLKWTPSEDDRVEYHVYELKEGNRKKIGTVKGKGEFTKHSISFFGSVSYQIVPFNPLTEQEGDPSNETSIGLMDRFRDDKEEKEESEE